MINFNTDNLIIVCYPRNAGGKFLINSLGLSDCAVFQHAILAQQQIDGGYSQIDKINYLKKELREVGTEWNDLNLGCHELFCVENNIYTDYPSGLIKKFTFNQTVETLSNSSFKFFIVAHQPLVCERYLEVWPNAKVIYFKNCAEFISTRPSQIQRQWDVIKGPSWPNVAPTNIDEFNSLPEFVKQELDTFLYSVKFQLYSIFQFQQLAINDHEKSISDFSNCIQWDTNNYFSIDSTVKEIEKLYNLLELNNFNEEAIREYYILWANKLKEIASK